MAMKKDSFVLLLPVSAEDFDELFRLRWEVLRKPWNQPLGSERDELEQSAHHLMIRNAEGTVIAAGRVQENEQGIFQVRYMAVHPIAQGKGAGRMILNGLEEIARTNGASLIFLQARENAVQFYAHCGYAITEKTFLLYDEIQHFRMEKKM